ncbi:MAG: zf-HC2 domain-containing protein [Vicinamibacterales bacterium]
MKTTPSDRCRALLERLSRYIDDDLTPAERRALTAHLRRCPCCQTTADSLKHTVDACRKAGTARLPADVRLRARARIATLLGPDAAARSRT